MSLFGKIIRYIFIWKTFQQSELSLDRILLKPGDRTQKIFGLKIKGVQPNYYNIYHLLFNYSRIQYVGSLGPVFLTFM